MAYFVMESFKLDKTFESDEMANLVAGHREVIKNAVADGTILFTGTKTDGSGSIAIMRADSIEAADAFFDTDPFRTAGVQRNTFKEIKINFFTDGVKEWLDK